LAACYLIDIEAAPNGMRLIFYDPSEDTLTEVPDEEYKPYFYLPHPLPPEARTLIESLHGRTRVVEKRELFTGELKPLTKVEVEDPSDIQKLSRRLKNSWEDDVPPALGYAYDHDLSFGAPYHIGEDSITPAYEIPSELKPLFEERFREVKARDPKKYALIERWFSLCYQPIPEASPAKLGIAGEITRENLYLSFMLARVASLPIPTASSSRKVSTWIRSMLHAFLRRENILIPKPEELRRGKEVHRVKGGLTIPPESGVHFNTVVVDFESLYPSLIDAYNLSYETVDCGHPECADNKVPGTEHHVCKKRRGIYAILIGALKDLRIRWFKPLSKDPSLPESERRLAEAAARLLKLILVASYGVTVRIRGLAQPALAESITAYGRHSLKEAWRIATEMGLHPLYGDTDSLFLDNPSEEAVNSLIRRVKRDLLLDLAVDKRYSVCILPRAMKAYIGIQRDGTPDVKGLTALKSNSPRLVQKVFMRCVKELTEVRNWAELEMAKERIRRTVDKAIEDLKAGRLPLEDLEYSVRLHFNPYEKGVHAEALHQPYQCAVQLLDSGLRVDIGEEVRFVKVKPFKYRGKTFTVKPTALVRGFHEVNVDDYVKSLISALNQTFKPMGMAFGKSLHRDLADFM